MRYLIVALVACAPVGKRNVPEGPQPAEAPPTSDTEATAPPQVAPELAHPMTPETKTLEGAPPPKQPETQPLTAPTPPAGKSGSPTITKGKIEISGTGKIDGDAVSRSLNKNAANFQLCYERSLLADPAIEGKVTLVFDIDTAGNVTGKTMGTVNDAVEKCVIDSVTHIAFPKPTKASVEVSYPMTFGWK